MVFSKENNISVAFTVKRNFPGDVLHKERAKKMALQKLLAEETASLEALEIEAFENEEGWLVFCRFEKAPLVEVYMQFACKNDFLDGVRAVGLDDVSALGFSGEVYVVCIKGSPEATALCCQKLDEFGKKLPKKYAYHLIEQQ